MTFVSVDFEVMLIFLLFLDYLLVFNRLRDAMVVKTDDHKCKIT